ncbi:hypothetical protein JJB07_01750 [Tumebacillus sp. ITR2]|uniref:Uncharacterized protein n=1 Tax=Tumebacillus amylolyticus TaxID=2801339 RepID=A0ABS1J504_9BACL|nr:hypothetical protein [Tumebacillus amylolyticus]MBL0385358.1 hypothetical protein [Tumebacillus amylolyticus]
MLHNRTDLLPHYETLRALAADPDRFFENEIGRDLGVDGLNVLLAVSSDDFTLALETFHASYDFDPDSKTSCLHALHRFTLDAARIGEFELYQSLAIGMTWLSLQEETHASFFNRPLRIPNHSAALLLSPTYQAIWVQSYNAGITLSPEVQPHLQNFHHSMAQVMLFHDLYPRVLGESSAEDATAFTHMETSISCLDELIQSEIMAVRADLHLIRDSYLAHSSCPEYGRFRYEVMQNLHTPVSRRSLALYRKHFVLRAEDEDCHLPNNRLKRHLLALHELPDEEIEILREPFARSLHDQKTHASWAKKAALRNRIPSYRAVIELLPHETYCLQKFQECLHPDAWTDAVTLLSSETLPELDATRRRRNQQRWKWRDSLYRIAELRGFLETEAGDRNSLVQSRLLAFADQAATVLREQDDENCANHEAFSRMFASCLAEISAPELRRRAMKLFEHPFSYLLEPR